SLVPLTAAHLLIQTALLLALGAGLLGSAALLRWAVPSPPTGPARPALAALVLMLTALIVVFWPGATPPPLLPALALAGLAALPILAPSGRARVQEASPGG